MRDAAELRDRVESFMDRTARRRHEPWLASRLALARQNWKEGLLAAALASGLWLHTVPGATLDRSSKAIPIVIDNMPEGYRISAIDPPEVEVEFEGLRRDLVLTGSEELHVRVDGWLVQQGRRTFALVPDQVEHPPELRVVGIAPMQVKLNIEAL
jgi:hypothetical protein